jgi:hypothetical protein
MAHDDDDEEEEEEEDEHETRKKTITAAQKLAGMAVPEGGYDEDEDCVNAEDEEYRAVLERMAKEVDGGGGKVRKIWRFSLLF